MDNNSTVPTTAGAAAAGRNNLFNVNQEGRIAELEAELEKLRGELEANQNKVIHELVRMLG